MFNFIYSWCQNTLSFVVVFLGRGGEGRYVCVTVDALCGELYVMLQECQCRVAISCCVSYEEFLMGGWGGG